MNKSPYIDLSIIDNDINSFKQYYDDTLKSNVKLINTAIRYISKSKGKQLRPILTLLGANICGKPNSNTYRSAALVEILHVATLIHDDIIDESQLRRGLPSINRIWKNKISLLIGDYLFSKVLSNMIAINNFDALKSLSITAERLSQGELLQIEKAIKKDMTEEIYFKMVSDKTASLFSTACEIGAITTTESIQKIEALKAFGEKVGIAFQIKDDLFDILGNVDGLGKPTGYDVKKNMLTLPLIHVFSKLNKIQKKKFQIELKRFNKKNNLERIRQLIDSNGGVEYAKETIHRISDEARKELEIFPKSRYKEALYSILDFNINRVH